VNVDFETLYRRYGRDVYRFALFLCGRPEQADDIAAETFVRAWTSPEPMRVGTVKAYLFTMRPHPTHGDAASGGTVNVTRDVIRDLSSLAAAGEATDDSRQLIKDFLANDPAFAQSLNSEGNMLNALAPELPADHEAKTLTRMKRQLDRRSPIRILALGFTGLTIARLIEQTTFTRSPQEVILLAIVAAMLWIAYGWHTRRLIRRGVFSAK
jgi:hypothetical protein